MLGLAFKPNTDDIRDAKSLVLIEEILNKGGSVHAYAPVAQENVEKVYPQIQYADHVFDVAEGADAIILVTEWNEFKQLDLEKLGSKMKNRILFDGRRVYSRASMEKAGFEYYTIGQAQ